MKRLRHPIRAIEEPFGKAGLTVAVIALVLALTGAAFAAAGLNGKQKKEVEKIAKKFAGKPGAAGAAGATGPAGPAGKDGANGTNGANGTSVTTSSIPTSSATCSHNGGVEVKSASPTQNVCNGTTGFTKILPSGQTETGSFYLSTTGEGAIGTAISFPIPLGSELAGTSVHFAPNAQCPGTKAEPLAEPGNLCVYAGVELHMTPQTIMDPASDTLNQGAATAGAVLNFEAGSEAPRIALGTWAVTAE